MALGVLDSAQASGLEIPETLPVEQGQVAILQIHKGSPSIGLREILHTAGQFKNTGKAHQLTGQFLV